jgi:hypothetical protein
MDPSGPMGFLVPLLDYKLGLFFRKRLPVVLHRPRARRHLQRAYSNLPLDHPKKNVRQFWLATLDETTEMTRCPPEYIVSFFFQHFPTSVTTYCWKTGIQNADSPATAMIERLSVAENMGPWRRSGIWYRLIGIGLSRLCSLGACRLVKDGPCV